MRVIQNIVATYRNPIIQLYARIRFIILRQRFLDEIEQYLPNSGTVIDIGCGFGLFSLYFATVHPQVKIIGLDIDARRIDYAKASAKRLGLANVEFHVQDAKSFTCPDGISCAYMLDIMHHIPQVSGISLLHEINAKLLKDGVLIIKDVDTTPIYKRWFTWLLDKMMDPRADVNYWSKAEMINLLKKFGTVYSHAMVDILPYPHILYIIRKAQNA